METTEFGVQINGCNRDVDVALKWVAYMRLGWIKQQVRWGDMARSRTEIDWSCLDRVVPKAHAAGFKVLLSVTTAPQFTRRYFTDTHGPPDDFAEFGLFVGALLTRYRGKVQAIELWNEPNLSAEWNSAISGPAYGLLLQMGYVAAKYVDPSVMVISAGLAPTAFDSVWTHVDDAGFTRRILEWGGGRFFDCFGAHANGPDGVGDIDLVAARYFELNGHRKPVCVTEFGYGLPVQGQSPNGFDWVMSHTPERQAEVLVGGLNWARRSGYARLVILWNLDYDGPPSDPNAPYALIREGWVSPAVEALMGWEKR